MDILLLRLEAPLMSFGGPMVDQQGVIQEFPALCMLTGLIGNALGYDHSEADRLESLQGRIRYAVRADDPGHRMPDYQTVDLGQDFLVGTGWTTRGVVSERGKGEATSGTHIRFRDYLADARYLVALALRDGAPTLAEVRVALARPARPLFLGRKPCLPAAPLFWKQVQGESLLSILQAEPWLAPTGSAVRKVAPPSVAAWWPVEDGESLASRTMATVDERDWRNQIVTGRRLIRQGLLTIPSGTAQPTEARHE